MVVTYSGLEAQYLKPIQALASPRGYECVCIDIEKTEKLKNFFLENVCFFIGDVHRKVAYLLDINKLSSEQLMHIEEYVGGDANIELALKWAARGAIKYDNFYEYSIDSFIDNLLKKAQKERLELLCRGIARQCYRHKDACVTTFYAAGSPADISDGDWSDS